MGKTEILILPEASMLSSLELVQGKVTAGPTQLGERILHC